MPRMSNLPGWLEHEPVFLRSFGNQEIPCLQAFWKVILWVCCSSNAGCSEVRCTFRLLPRALRSWGACLANPVNRQQLLPFRLLLHKKTHLVFSATTGRSKRATVPHKPAGSSCSSPKWWMVSEGRWKQRKTQTSLTSTPPTFFLFSTSSWKIKCSSRLFFVISSSLRKRK